jgi:SAM-dependent methyltransferase
MSLMAPDPAQRFSLRVKAYVRYRPSYPAEVLGHLARECELNAYTQVADIGAGTGILSKLFLEAGCEVTGVEPNAEMRSAGDELLAGYPRFRSVCGRAEDTGLADHSYDLAAAGQAFHWFDPGKARAEFRRILRPPRWVALIWNERLTEGDAFLEGYEQLLARYGTDYAEVDHRRVDAAELDRFFEHHYWTAAEFPNAQEFDLEGVRGRLESSSYVPEAGTAAHSALITGVSGLFARCSTQGHVTFRYRTVVYTGTLA